MARKYKVYRVIREIERMTAQGLLLVVGYHSETPGASCMWDVRLGQDPLITMMSDGDETLVGLVTECVADAFSQGYGASE